MINKIRIWWHKREARYWYSRINELYELYDCGEDLIDMCTGGRLSRFRENFNWHIAILKRIDPKFKK